MGMLAPASRRVQPVLRVRGVHRLNLQIVVLASLPLSLLACSGSGSKPDLPAGWGSAQSVKSFAQAACGGSADAPGAPTGSIAVDAGQGAVNVAYHNAHFRCDQSVEGFMRTGPKSVDFLVQPTDMNPSSTAGCDCLYEITMATNVPSGPTTVSVYQRWDNQSGIKGPIEIGTATATVR
jgi:hypothetical protein